MTWCSPPLSVPLYSLFLFTLQSTFLTKNLHQSLKMCSGTKAKTIIVKTPNGKLGSYNLKMWKPLFVSFSTSLIPPPPSAWTSHQAFAFEVDHLCQPCCQFAYRAPYSSYTHTHTRAQWCRAGMLSPSPLAVQLVNPWTQLDSLRPELS